MTFITELVRIIGFLTFRDIYTCLYSQVLFYFTVTTTFTRDEIMGNNYHIN